MLGKIFPKRLYSSNAKGTTLCQFQKEHYCRRGDEFFTILEDTDQKNARYLAERLCSAVNDLNIRADDHTRLGVSIGLAQLKEDEDLRDWLERADDILYNAKALGRFQVAVS